MRRSIPCAVLLSLAFASLAGAQLQPPPGHSHMFLWSTEKDGGDLAIEFDFHKRILVTKSICFQSQEDASQQCFYNGLDPAFFAYDTDHPTKPLYALDEGTTLGMEIIAMDAAASVKVNDTVLSKPNDAARIATIMTGLHNHPGWQLQIPEGEHGNYPFSFRVTSESPTYGASPVYDATITNIAYGDATCDESATAADLVAVARAAGGKGPACSPDIDNDSAVSECDRYADAAYIFGEQYPATGCPAEPITIPFRAVVGDQPFACGSTYEGLGTANTEVIPADLRFYLSDMRLVRSDGTETPLALDQDGLWQYQDLALLDFEDKSGPCRNGTVQTNTVIRGMAPPYAYKGLHFTLGVPFSLNHNDPTTAPSPLNILSLSWGWQAGYRFFLLDTALDNLRLHIGSTGCAYGPDGRTVASCSHPNRGDIELTGYDPSSSEVVADLAALFADSDLSSNVPDTPPGCESNFNDTDCDPMFRNLGIDFSTGQPSPGTQKFFRIEPAS